MAKKTVEMTITLRKYEYFLRGPSALFLEGCMYAPTNMDPEKVRGSIQDYIYERHQLSVKTKDILLRSHDTGIRIKSSEFF